jgi:hypothetical protein
MYIYMVLSLFSFSEHKHIWLWAGGRIMKWVLIGYREGEEWGKEEMENGV